MYIVYIRVNDDLVTAGKLWMEITVYEKAWKRALENSAYYSEYYLM